MAKTLILVLCIIVMNVSMIFAKKCDKKCFQARSHGMRSADCYKLDLTEVPQCLRDDIQILDLSTNRLRIIKNESFTKYTSLKFLYLQDNLIVQIEPNAFLELESLEVLDLSLNGFQTLPPVIFHLPSLKRLYLGKNMNINIAEIFENAQPITAPLEHLDLSFNELHQLPDLGVLPEIFTYNISGNDLDNMTPKNFAGLCKLTVLYNDNFTVEFQDMCDCWKLKDWFEERNVKLTGPIVCKEIGQEDNCNTRISDEDREIFGQCKSIRHTMSLTKSFVNIGLPILGALLLISIIVGYYFCKKCKRKKENVSTSETMNLRST